MSLPLESTVADSSAGGAVGAAAWAATGSASTAGGVAGVSAAGADSTRGGADAGDWAATGAGSGAGCAGGVTTSTGLMAGGGGGMGFADAVSADRPLDDTTRFGLLDTTAGDSSTAADSPSLSVVADGASSDVLAAAAFFAAFFGGGFLVETTAGFSAEPVACSAGSADSVGGLIRPSRLALRRTRSACASTMLEEWLFTPIPRSTQRSMISLLERFISLANSYTRTLDGTLLIYLWVPGVELRHTCCVCLLAVIL